MGTSGGLGIDFSNNLEDIEGGLEKVAHYLLKTGVTSFCPTLVSSSPDVYVQVIQVFSFYMFVPISKKKMFD